jgi:release factor glutamine methyltransferase
MTQPMAGPMADPAGGVATPAAPAATVGELLGTAIARLRAAGAELPRLDAEVLLGHAIELDRAALIAHPEKRVERDAATQFRADIERREHGEPVAYIRGVKEFMGLRFRVDQRALIPRPETERLVELGLQAVEAAVGRVAPPVRVRVADVGTGSGAIAVALAARLRLSNLLGRVDILATDRSSSAISLAAENLFDHRLTGDVRLVEADLLPDGGPRFDVLIANLPYIPSGEIAGLPVAASFEPREALDGGQDGLEVLRHLLDRLPSVLASHGVALLEIGAAQSLQVMATVEALGGDWTCRVERDLSGLPRVAVVRRLELERSSIASVPDGAGAGR